MPWTADNAKANGRGDKREKRTEYTKLDMPPWICTAVGCKQTKHWNIYTKCTDCNAARWTPPLTKLPGTHDATDWEAEYKALEAQRKHDKPSDQKELIVVDAPQDIASDTDTDSEDEIGTQLAKELEDVIAQFAKLGQTVPQLGVVKQLVTVTKRNDNPILTDAQVELEITKEKIKETEQDYASVLAFKERWLVERLQRFAETRKNVSPEDAKRTHEAADPAGRLQKGAAASSGGA